MGSVNSDRGATGVAGDLRPRLNREWHLANKMPPKATFEQRVEWHREHAKYCRCREMPENIAEYIRTEAKG